MSAANSGTESDKASDAHRMQKRSGSPAKPVAAIAERAGRVHQEILREIAGVRIEHGSPFAHADANQKRRGGHDGDEDRHAGPTISQKFDPGLLQSCEADRTV